MTILRKMFLLTIAVAACGLTVGSIWADDTRPVPASQTPNEFDTPILAQGPGGPGDRPGGRMHQGPFGGDPMRQRKHLEQLRILKMLELLNLTPEQELPFLTAFNQMRMEHQALEDKANVLLDSMAAELALASPKEARLKDLIARTRTIEQQRFGQMTTFVDKVDDLLTTEQIAKLMIFQKRFEMELLEQIGRFRRGRPGGPEAPPDSSGF